MSNRSLPVSLSEISSNSKVSNNQRKLDRGCKKQNGMIIRMGGDFSKLVQFYSKQLQMYYRIIFHCQNAHYRRQVLTIGIIEDPSGTLHSGIFMNNRFPSLSSINQSFKYRFQIMPSITTEEFNGNGIIILVIFYFTSHLFCILIN